MISNLKASLTYWPLSLFYFAFFCTLGALLPYWALYLQAIGFSALEIGELMAMLLVTKIFGPNVWGWLADRTGRPLLILRVGAGTTLAIFSLVYNVEGFWEMALVMIGYSFFWNAVLPQLEALALTELEGDMHLYSVVRLWGSVGFIVMVLLTGLYIDLESVMALPLIVIVTMVALLVSSLLLKEPSKEADDCIDDCIDGVDKIEGADALNAPNKRGEAGNSDTRLFGLFNRDIATVLLITFLMQVSHGPYYTFYTLYLERYHFSPSLIGWLWTLGVIAEIIFFVMIPKWKGELLAYTLLIASLLLASFRWAVIGLFPDQSVVIIAMQLLHAASYGAFHLAIIAYIHTLFKAKHRSQGQAFYSSVGYGLGGALGAYASGLIWKYSSPEATFVWAALFSLLGALVAWRCLKEGACSALKV